MRKLPAEIGRKAVRALEGLEKVVVSLSNCAMKFCELPLKAMAYPENPCTPITSPRFYGPPSKVQRNLVHSPSQILAACRCRHHGF